MSALLPVLSDAAHESLCRRCGITCHVQVDSSDPNRGIIPELRCKFLGGSTAGEYFCQVYDHRFEAAPWCSSATDAAKVGALAHDCPYMDAADYRGKVWATGAELDRLRAIARGSLIADGLPLSCNPDAALGLLPGWKFEQRAEGYRFFE